MEEKKKKKIIIIMLLSVTLIIGIIATMFLINNNTKKESSNQKGLANNTLPNKNISLTSISKNDLKDGYSIKIGDNFYSFPTNDIIKSFNSYGEEEKKPHWGSRIYIYDDSKIPTFNFNNNDIQFIYQGENDPKTIIYKMAEPQKVVGITLDKEKKVTEILSSEIPKEVIGYNCEILDNNNIKIDIGDIVVNNDTNEIKLAFSKGTYRKEITVKKFLLTNLLVNAYVEDTEDYFTKLELTNENYANIIKDREKQLTDGYYCIVCNNESPYYFKIEQGMNDTKAIADERLQLEIKTFEEAVRLIATPSNINSYNNYCNKIFANTTIYKPIYSDYKEPLEEYSVYPKIGKIIGINGATTLSKDYYGMPYSMSSSIVLDNQRYIKGKIEFKDTYVSRIEYSIEYLMKIEDYKDYLSNLSKYYDSNKILDSTKAINSISFEDFKGFITRYTIAEGKTISDTKYRYGVKVIE